MHQEKDDAKQADAARDIELDDAELENAAGGVVINHEEQYSLLLEKEDFESEDLNKMKLGDVLKKD